MSVTNTAHAMPQIHAVCTARSLHRPMMHGKRHRVTLPQRHHLRARLHAWTLLRQYKIPAGKIASRLREQDRHLDRKHMLSVQILVQAVVVTFPYSSSSGVGRRCPAS